jgi:hypothetical protein
MSEPTDPDHTADLAYSFAVTLLEGNEVDRERFHDLELDSDGQMVVVSRVEAGGRLRHEVDRFLADGFASAQKVADHLVRLNAAPEDRWPSMVMRDRSE